MLTVTLETIVAAGVLQGHARRVFFSAFKTTSCHVCGYSKHVEIAHKRAVADFPVTATVGEINNLENLMSLCPNHHWEHDHPNSPSR